MGVKNGNVIDYRNDPHMDNADEGEKPKMGFMGSGFGSPGVRETKTVSGATEIVIPVKQSLTIAIGTALLLISVYGVTKIFIISFSDWLLLIGIVTIVGLPILLIGIDRLLKYQTPNFYAGVIRFFNSIVMGHNLAAFILMVLAIVFVVYLIGDFYVSVIARQMAFTLDQQAHVVALVCAVIGWLVAYNPFKTFFSRQLTNSLRDSDSKYATASLQYEDYWRKRKAGIIEGEFTVSDDEEESTPVQQKLLGHHIVANPAAGRTFKPGTEDLLFEMMVNEFLDGLESKAWTTSERSWKGKRLVRSGVDLPVVGDEIRDSLISGHWASWTHPSQPNQGWKLDAPISHIRGSAFAKSRVSKKQLVAPILVEDDDNGYYSGTAGSDSEEDGDDADWSPENG